MSRRHSDSAVLEAARECVADLGVRRTTVSDVARRAGASRMTVYRMFPDARSLWSTLLTTEFSDVVRAAEEETAHLRTARERLAATAVSVVRRLAADPVVRRVIELDPDLLLPYLVERLGQSQRIAMAHFSRLLDEGAADGSIRAVDAATVTYVLQLMVGSMVIAARVTEREVDPESAMRELHHLLDAYLAPVPS